MLESVGTTENVEVWQKLESESVADDAEHWIRVYSELAKMLDRLVQASLAEHADPPPALRRQLAAVRARLAHWRRQQMAS